MPYPDPIYFLHVGILLLIIFVLVSYIIAGAIGAPFVPTELDRVEDMADLALVQAGDKAVDLGSGDGRVLVALARAGAEVHGYEINPVLVLWSKFQLFRNGVSHLGNVHWKSFWNVDLSGFDLITIYGNPKIMERLETKLQREMNQEARLIAYNFPLPNWQSVKQQNDVYLYTRSSQPGSS